MTSVLAATQSRPALIESLPVEIQIHILRSLPDIKTLGSLLRASPQYLQVHLSVREDVISHIVCNQITHFILPLAIDVLQQSYLRSTRRPRSKVPGFLETFKEPRLAPPQSIFSLKLSKRLLKTQYKVEYFTCAFITDRLAQLSRSIPHIAPLLIDTRLTLASNEMEYLRLARALYHLELYGTLFHDPQDSDDVITVQEQSSLFLAKLPPWELEEFHCVREYLLDRLSSYLDQAGEDFMQGYIEEGPPPDIARYPNDMRFEYDDEYWYFFSMDGQSTSIQYRWMEGALTKGLEVLKQILESTTADERYDSLGDHAIDRPRNTMKEALEALPCIQDHPELVQSENSLENPNDAWLWALNRWVQARKGCPELHSSSARLFKSLRGWCYVIWSNKTLGIMGLLQEPKSIDWEFKKSVLIRHVVRADDLPLCFSDQERRRGLSVEMRTRSQYVSWREEALEEVQAGGFIE